MGNVLYERIFGDKIGKEIQSFVKKNGVNTINNRKVKEVKYDGNKKVLVLDDGERVTADMVIYGIGEECNTDYVPNEYKDSRDKSIIVDKFL